MSVEQQDELFSRISAGGALTDAELAQLAASHDILSLGALADAVRGRIHGARTTYVRVATCPWDKPIAEAVPPTAGEIRLTGQPPSIDAALNAIRTARAVAGPRPVSGFSVRGLAMIAGAQPLSEVFAGLRIAGFDMVAEVALDGLPDAGDVVESLAAGGIEQIRLTIDSAPASERLPLFIRARALKERFPAIRAIHPLPLVMSAFKPTTGFDDTRSVALARLAAPNIESVQVDWQRYGPKLAQVVLTFGADDLDNVSPFDDDREGVRRTAAADVTRNIAAAGFTPAERDGRFLLR